VTPSIYSLFVLGAVLTCILTPLIRHFALRKGFVDCPQRARKVHQQATPRLGGAAILTSYLSVVLVGGVFIPQLREMLWGENAFGGFILVGAIAIFVIGIFDDLSRLSPKTKLVGEFLVAATVVWGARFSFTEVQFLGLGTISFPEWFGFALACLWIVGMAMRLILLMD